MDQCAVPLSYRLAGRQDGMFWDYDFKDKGQMGEGAHVVQEGLSAGDSRQHSRWISMETSDESHTASKDEV